MSKRMTHLAAFTLFEISISLVIIAFGVVTVMTFRGGAPYMDYSGQWRGPNMGGTIQMIQRLVHEPTTW